MLVAIQMKVGPSSPQASLVEEIMVRTQCSCELSVLHAESLTLQHCICFVSSQGLTLIYTVCSEFNITIVQFYNFPNMFILIHDMNFMYDNIQWSSYRHTMIVISSYDDCHIVIR